MPKFNHDDLGDLLGYEYKDGMITKLNYDTDCATITIEGGGSNTIPIYYHHSGGNWTVRDNGAIKNASYAFDISDIVIVRCKVTAAGSVPFQVVGGVRGLRKNRCCLGLIPESITSWTFGDGIKDAIHCEDLDCLRLALKERVEDVGGEMTDDLSDPKLMWEEGKGWTDLFDSILFGILGSYLNHTKYGFSEWMKPEELEDWNLSKILEYLGEELIQFTDCSVFSAWVAQRRRILRLLQYLDRGYDDVYELFSKEFKVDAANQIFSHYDAWGTAMGYHIVGIHEPDNWATDWKNTGVCWNGMDFTLSSDGTWRHCGKYFSSSYGYSGGMYGTRDRTQWTGAGVFSLSILNGYEYKWNSWISGRRQDLKLKGYRSPFSYRVYLEEETEGATDGTTGINNDYFEVEKDTEKEFDFVMYDDMAEPTEPPYLGNSGGNMTDLIHPQVGERHSKYDEWIGTFNYGSVNSVFSVSVKSYMTVKMEKSSYVFS